MSLVEEQFVELILNEVTNTVADRTGGIHQPPWRPDRHVKVGVLRPRRLKDPASPDASDEVEGIAAQELSDPDLIGLDFVVERPTDGKPVLIRVSALLILYQPLFPEFAVAKAMFGNMTALDEVGSRGVPLLPAWKRYEIRIGDVDLELPVDGSHVSGADLLNAELKRVVDTHFSLPNAFRPFEGGTKVVEADDLASESTYESILQSKANESWQPTLPLCRLEGFAEQLPDDKVLVSVSLENESVVSGDYIQDLAFYDCGLEIEVISPGPPLDLQFDLAPDDYRYREIAREKGHGRRAVAVYSEGVLRTETLPRYYQKTMIPRTDRVPDLRWADLAENPQPILDQVGMQMRMFLREWDEQLREMGDPEEREASAKDRDAFAEEVATFELGLEALRVDQRLERAFKLANQAFSQTNAHKSYDSWRLFQLVYIVMHLPALAAREHRQRTDFRKELDKVDVLWFPTGGGKTEAYLGLILVAAFYDRLRGKTQGVTAWLKFPLRMLSVQQLSRVLRVLVHAEKLRRSEGIDGAPFELGYLVGGSNTPNEMRWANGWWPGFAGAVAATRTDPTLYDSHRLVGDCPFCGAAGSVGLVAKPEEYRLDHVCRTCGQALPIHMTDDQVYRYQPTVIVSTVDKITGFAHFGEFTAFNHGPRKRCPTHGFFSFGKCPVRSEQVHTLTCKHKDQEYQIVEWHDPVPSVTVQDELHLVKEELGAFTSHLESLVAHLQKTGPSQMATKVLGASATIEQFEDQLRQVYGRRPRRFPSPGYKLGSSFYVETLNDTRRVFLGIMPSGGKTAKVEVAAQVQAAVVKSIHRWQNHPKQLRQQAQRFGFNELAGLTDTDILRLLFDYEVSLGFVNSKAHGTMIANELAALSDRFESEGQDRLIVPVLTGEVSVPELADVITKVERATLATPRSERVRAVVGTSVVSHGVDLERLNVMVMAGLPSTTADYIQATSRAGRTHVGVVVTVYDDFQRRESSAFTHFGSTHRLMDVLVEPVPVNRYAHQAVQRTLPAVVMAILWDLARNQNLSPPSDGIRRTRDFKKWWDTVGVALTNRLEADLQQAYRSPVPGVNPSDLEDKLAEAALADWRYRQAPSVQKFDADKTKDLFRSPGVMPNLRDVENPVEFGGFGQSKVLYRLMFPERAGEG